jgi:hypothetical protein
MKGKSPSVKVKDTLESFYLKNSTPYKKLTAATLNEQSEKCYPEKWMSESFSNAE